MSLIKTIEAEAQDALRGKDHIRLSTLRLLKASIKNKEVELRRKLNEPEIIGVVNAQIRQRRDAIKEYTRAGRMDLAEKEKAEETILSAYVPVQLSRQDLEKEIRRIISATGATGPRDVGKVMKMAMSDLAGRADGKIVNELARSLLS